MAHNAHRDTIFPLRAKVLSHQAREGNQYILRVEAPECAQHALPGSFAHIQVDPGRPLRRPISIMRVSREAGWVEFLYKIVGEGTRLLSNTSPGDVLDMLAPIGVPFQFNQDRPRPLLIGGGVGMPPMIFATQWLHENKHPFQPMVILGSEVPFPFDPRPSRIFIPAMPEGVIACLPLLDDWGIPSRLTSLQGYPGCHQGYVTELARHWLTSLDESVLNGVEIFACGPHLMLKAVAELARSFHIPCQVSLEEYMACGVGGCAGCVVPLETKEGKVMRRVCVDGPVFDAQQVFPARPPT